MQLDETCAEIALDRVSRVPRHVSVVEHVDGAFDRVLQVNTGVFAT
jgi:hypothetical protein